MFSQYDKPAEIFFILQKCGCPCSAGRYFSLPNPFPYGNIKVLNRETSASQETSGNLWSLFGLSPLATVGVAQPFPESRG